MSGLVQIRRPGAPAGDTTAQPEPRRRAYVETYGCQMNVADTQMMLGLLARAGYAATDRAEDADVILINTCAVREKAEERVFGRVGTLAQHKQNGRRVVLGVTGCMAEHLKESLPARAPHVDLVVGPDGYRRLIEHLEAKLDEPADGAAREATLDTQLNRFETYEGLDPERAALGDSSGVTGHLTIQRGCDKFCTFCIVPYTRGRERGIAPREILRQAHAMAAAGFKEIQLLGQTVNSYRYEDVGFADILRAVATVPGIARVRFTSPYPLDFSPDVIAAMAENDTICRHVHLPLQSGADTVLERMRRGYTMAEYRGLVAALRAAMPDIAITTDIMVGFCDESDAEFEATLAAMAEIRFDNAFTFAYSERSGTVAARKMPDTVSEEVKQERLARVIAAQRATTTAILRAQVGKRERVLVEAPSRRSDQEWLARTSSFRSVILPAGPDVAPGTLLDVVIESTTTATLRGRVASAVSL